MLLCAVQCFVVLLVAPQAVASDPCDCYDSWYFNERYAGSDVSWSCTFTAKLLGQLKENFESPSERCEHQE